MSALAFKNTMLKYWPRTTVNGVETFGRLILWKKSVLKDNAHRRIYKQLGMKIKDMEKESYSGINYTYLYLAPYSAPNGLVTQNDIRSYICEYTPMIYPASKDVFNPDPLAATDLNPDPNKGTVDAYWDAQGWITASIVYTPTKLELVDSQITDAQILAKCREMATAEIFFDPTLHNRTTVVALMDADKAVFENTIRVVSRNVVLKDTLMTANNIGRYNGVASQQVRYLQSANIELKFRRIADISVGETLTTGQQALISLIETKIEALDDIAAVESTFNRRLPALSITAMENMSRRAYSSHAQQLIAMSNWVTPFTDDGLITTTVGGSNGYYIDNENASVKPSGLTDLPPAEFKKEFLKLVKFDYKVKKKKGHWYDKIVSIVIVVVAVVIAVMSYGTATSASAGLLSAATALSVGALALTGWAMYLAENGGSSGGISLAGKLSEFLGVAAMIAGIAAIYQSWQQQLSKEVLQDQLKQAAIDMAQAGADDVAMAAVGDAIVANAGSMTSMASIGLQAVGAASELGQEFGLFDSDVGMIIGAATGAYDSMASVGLDSVSTITIDSVADNLAAGVTKFVSQPLSAIMNKVVNWLNMGFNMYAKLVSPGDEGLADKKAELEALEKEVENTNPENSENIWKVYQDPYGSVFEVGDHYDKIYPMMTQGSITRMMNQCYYSWS